MKGRRWGQRGWAAACLGLGLVAAAGARADTLLPGAFSGGAYGAFANAQAGPVAVQIGRVANLPCPCQGTNGKTLTNTVDSVSAGTGGGVLKAGVVTSTVLTEKTATSADVHDTSTIANLNLLGGLITADAIKAVATVTAGTQTIAGSADGSTFVNLRIGGKPVAVDVKPETRITLSGIGSVTLEHVKKGGDGKTKGSILVEMLTVNITQANALGLPIGAKIVVAHAQSGFTRQQPEAVVGGQAYAAQANAAIGSVLRNKIGKAAFVSMGCLGTGGKTLTNDVGALAVGNVLAFGAGQTTAFGGPGGGGTIARTTARITGLSALGGLITADAITAVAQETYAGGKRTRSPSFSLLNLKVAGIPVAANVAPNTRLNLLGLGHATVNEQIVPAGSGGRTQVNGLHIVVTVGANPLGLPVGAEIIIAHADATAKRF